MFFIICIYCSWMPGSDQGRGQSSLEPVRTQSTSSRNSAGPRCAKISEICWGKIRDFVIKTREDTNRQQIFDTVGTLTFGGTDDWTKSGMRTLQHRTEWNADSTQFFFHLRHWLAQWGCWNSWNTWLFLRQPWPRKTVKDCDALQPECVQKIRSYPLQKVTIHGVLWTVALGAHAL